MLGLIALLVGGIALFLVTTKEAGAMVPGPPGPPGEAVPGPPGEKVISGEPYEYYIPSTDEILSAESIGRLDSYHNLIGELSITGIIDDYTYDALYDAYLARYYELTGEEE